MFYNEVYLFAPRFSSNKTAKAFMLYRNHHAFMVQSHVIYLSKWCV